LPKISSHWVLGAFPITEKTFAFAITSSCRGFLYQVALVEVSKASGL
jgi:hypothetical protein